MLLPSFIDSWLIKVLAKYGYVRALDIDSADLARRACLLNSMDIDLVLDVGAKTGQYALQLRKLGYKDRIVSFEPMSDAFHKLRNCSKSDNLWDIYNIALGDSVEESLINISKNSISSSILKMHETHIKNASNSIYISSEKIFISKLDLELPKIIQNEKNIWLKIDVQGYELPVLMGATNSLRKVKIIQLEMSLEELYQGQASFSDILIFMEKMGSPLWALKRAFKNPKQECFYRSTEFLKTGISK